MIKTLKKTYSKNNNKIELISIGASNNNKTILIIGVVHGEEPQGAFLIKNYLQSFAPSPQPSPRSGEGACESLLTNNLLFIPCLNPDGMTLNKRQNSNGIDLNRNFPTKNWKRTSTNSEYFGGEKAASEIETKFVINIIEEFSPDIILTIHAPYKVVNYDGPAEKIAEQISEIIGYPTSNDIGYPTPGSFGTYAGVERNIPTITLELDEEIDVKELITPINKIFDYLSNMD